MRISIIIPTYNYGHYIQHAIDSVLAQQDPNYQLIIIDDGSTDNTASIISTYLQKQPKFVDYIYQDNSGPATARNRGAKAANGDYLLFLDADDRLLPGALKKFREFLANNPTVDMVCGGHLSVEPSGKTTEHNFKKPLTKEPLQNFLAYLHKELSLVNSCTLFHKRVFNKINYPEVLRNSEDIPLFAQTLALYNCAVLLEPVTAMAKHSDSLRHHAEYSRKAGTTVVDHIFNPAILPPEFLKFRQEYYAIRCLSLFRTAYLNKHYPEAKQYYLQAIKAYPLCLLKFSYLRKYLRILLKSYF